MDRACLGLCRGPCRGGDDAHLGEGLPGRPRRRRPDGGDVGGEVRPLGGARRLRRRAERLSESFMISFHYILYYLIILFYIILSYLILYYITLNSIIFYGIIQAKAS